MVSGALAVTFAITRPAAAQEIRLHAPLALREPMYAVSTPDAVARRHDFTVWAALGGTPAPDKAQGPLSGVGAELTSGLIWMTGVLGIPSELRWGPWAEMWTDGAGGRAEGGLAAQLYLFGRGVHSPVDVRAGGGYGEDALGRAPHVALTIAAGPRYIEAVPWHETIRSEDGSPRTPQLVAGWRLFLSARRTIEPAAQYWVSGGLELELGVTLRGRPVEDVTARREAERPSL